MALPAQKTKIVCTIGPASESPALLQDMLRGGMNVARLNFSHGDFDYHRRIIGNIRAAAHATGRRVAIMADLPGPKIRIGNLAVEPVELQAGERFTLTTEQLTGDAFDEDQILAERRKSGARAKITITHQDGRTWRV